MLFSARRVGLTAAACLFAFAVSCSGSRPPQSSGLPSLSSLDSRGASGVVDLTATGIETLARSAGAVELGSNLYLGATQGSAEWAVYRLQPPTGMIPSSAVVNLTDVSTDEAWIAVADYAALRWEFSGPYGAAADLSGLGADHVSPGGYTYLAVVVSGAHAGVVEGVSLTCEGNLPPVASFTATPQTGSPGTPVQLDASASSDPDGSIVKYEWDLDGDGSFETDNGSSPAMSTALPDPAGSVDVGLRVTDDGGGSATNSDTLSSYLTGGTWTTVTVGLGFSASLQVIDGKPAISYRGISGSDRPLMYAYSSTADGTSGWTSVTVNPSLPRILGTSLALINGKPAIAYSSESPTNLYYAWSTASDGSSGWNNLLLEAAGGGNNSNAQCLSLVVGKPAISFRKYNSGDIDLKYAYSSTSDGSSGWTTLTVDGGPEARGDHNSLAVVNGKPAITYADSDGHAVRYAYSSSSDGSSGWASLEVDSFGAGWCHTTSLLQLAGKPAFAYRVQESGGGYPCKLALSSIADGSSGWSTFGLDGLESLSGSSGLSLKLVQGQPSVLCAVSNDDPMYLTRTSVPDGSSGWSTETGLPNGGWSSLAEVDGKVAVAHYEGTSQELKYSILLP